MKFEIGYEIGSGDRVEADLHHLFVSGVTQHSGKTTSLEAFLSRVGRKALVFRCGRGEIGFDNATRIPPFFRERTDWQFVEGLISVHLREKMRFYRGDIMKAVRGAKTLEDVHRNVGQRLKAMRKDSFVEKILFELETYLGEVIPEVRKLHFSKDLQLVDGLNLIDLEGVPLATQQLVIASCVDRIMESMKDTIIVIPEAWQMIPGDRGSPVKLAVENMIRQGAKIGNYVWLDSQQLTGVDMDILRNIDIWLFGRQTLDLEKDRVARMIPGKRVSADQLHILTIGQFWVVQYNEKVRFVYVRPAWLPEDVAREIAMRRRKIDDARAYKPEPRVRPREDEDMVYKEKFEEAQRRAEALEKKNADLEAGFEAYKASIDKRLSDSVATKLDNDGEVKALRDALAASKREQEHLRKRLDEADRTPSERPVIAKIRPNNGDIDKIADDVIRRLEELSHPVWLRLSKSEPDLDVTITRPKFDEDDSTIRGKIAGLIAEGFFDEPRPSADIIGEAAPRGWGNWKKGGNRIKLFEELKWFCATGFLRNEGQTFSLLPGAKKRIKVREKED